MFTSCIEPINTFLDLDRHWHSGSQPLAGSDQLLTALKNGWQMDRVVFRTDYALSASRAVQIYHCILRRGTEKITMPVLAGPFLMRILNTLAVRIMPVKPIKSRLKHEVHAVHAAQTAATATVVHR